MNTRLRVLIDEAVEDDLADEIASISAFHAEYVRNIPSLRGRTDREIMAYAVSEGMIVMTFDSDYNSANFPICTHPGIIRLAGTSKHRTAVSDMIKKFSRCGYRSDSRHAITHLTQEYCNIEGTNEKVVQHRY